MSAPDCGPEDRAVRLTVVAHASPRYRGANSQAEADRKNLELSRKREQSVRVAAEQLIRGKLGAAVKILPGQSRPAGQVPTGVEVGGYSVGSRESLPNANGDRSNDDPAYRRVHVLLELLTTRACVAGQSQPTVRTSTRIRKWWRVRVNKLHVDYVGTPQGTADLTIINSLSNKSMRAEATLTGTGRRLRVAPSLNLPKFIVGTVAGSIRGDVDSYKSKDTLSFGCNREMGFADFNGQTVTFDKRTVTLLITGHIMSMRFDDLGDEAEMDLPTLGGVGLIGYAHYTMSGKLRMVGPNPGDWTDEDPTETFVVDATGRQERTATLTFPTGKSKYEEADFTDRMVFETAVEGYAERFKGP